MPDYLIKNASIITVNTENDILLNHDLLIKNGRIVDIQKSGLIKTQENTEVIDATDRVVTPGFIQTHIHLCQVMFRNLADDLDLMDWLRTRIWPYEAAHSPESLYNSANLGLAELIRSGTTCIQDMGTVTHTDAIAQALIDSGFRAYFGKCMMNGGDPAIPAVMLENTDKSLEESERLCLKYHNSHNERLKYCYCPRFAHSCSHEMLVESAKLARKTNARIHTHASETRFEVDETLRLHNLPNIRYLHECGISGQDTLLAHCVWVDENEQNLLAQTKTAVSHCPATNLKLASGIAPIPEMIKKGISVSLGSDGAPCNNTLDAQTEMKYAALIQKPQHGPKAMPARTVLRLATIDGAKALGLENEIGSIEKNKKADIVIHNLNHENDPVGGALESALVYSSLPHNVETVFVDGKILFENGKHKTINIGETRKNAKLQLQQLIRRVEKSL